MPLFLCGQERPLPIDHFDLSSNLPRIVGQGHLQGLVPLHGDVAATIQVALAQTVDELRQISISLAVWAFI